MIKERDGRKIVYKCGKKWDEQKKKTPIQKNKEEAVKEEAPESTEEVENNG